MPLVSRQSRDSARHRREVMYTALQVMYRADKGKEGGVNDQQRVKRVMCYGTGW